MAHSAGDFGKALRRDDDQGDNADQHQFTEADVKHKLGLPVYRHNESKACTRNARRLRRMTQASFFSLACTSMVSPDSTRWVTASGVSSEEASFMPFLKPLTAPPRSSPTLRSFLVPKTRATMTRTISQCQILKLPMMFSPVRRPLPIWVSRGAGPRGYENADAGLPGRRDCRCW